MAEEEQPPENNVGWMKLGLIKESQVEDYTHVEAQTDVAENGFPQLYQERNRDQMFMLLDRAEEKIEELFPDEENPEETYDNFRKRVKIEQIALFCQAAEDLGGIMFSIEHSDNQEEFAKYLQSYNTTQVRETFEEFLENDLEGLRPFLGKILNLPEPDDEGKSKEEEINITYERFFEMVESIAENYLDFVGVYNAYKHGYRVSWGETRTETPYFNYLGEWSTAEYIVDSPIHERTAFIYLADNTTKIFTYSEEKHDELRTLTSEADKIIILLRYNFKWQENRWFRRIGEETND